MREYALEQLAQSGEAERRAIATWPITWRWPSRPSAPHGVRTRIWLRRLDREMDNLRLAHDWAVTRANVEAEWRLVAALALFWGFRGYLREGSERLKRRWRRRMTPPQHSARFLEGAGLLAECSGDDERAIAHYEGSLAAARASG